MKKELPNNSLREKLDSMPFEFEEAHWDNLASQLHAVGGGEVPGKNGSGFFSLPRLGIALLLGLLLGGILFYTVEDSSPSLKEDLEVATKKNDKPIQTLTENSITEAIKKEEKQKKIEQGKTVEKKSLDKKAQFLKKTIVETKREFQAADKLMNNKNSFDLPQNSKLNQSSERAVSSEKPKNKSPEVLFKWMPKEGEHDQNTIQTSKIGTSEIASTEKESTTQRGTEVPTDLNQTPPSGRNKTAGLASIATKRPKMMLSPSKKYPHIVPPGLPAKRVRKNTIGIITGFNFSHGSAGLFAGVTVRRKLSPQWFLEAGISYRGSHIHQWNIDSSNVSYLEAREVIQSLDLLRYIDFPLSIKWRPIPQWSIQAGPKLGILAYTRGRVTQANIIDNSVDPPVVEYRTFKSEISVDRITSLRAIELGLTLGTTWHLDEHLGLGLRSHFGLTPFADPQILNPSPQKRNLDIQFLIQFYL